MPTAPVRVSGRNHTPEHPSYPQKNDQSGKNFFIYLSVTCKFSGYFLSNQ
jgi:hypothetical protein